jgi:hypothetical protein
MIAPIVRFYNATVDGWPRIAEIRSITQEGYANAEKEYFGEEIAWQDLPENFVEWRLYSDHADLNGNATVIWSPTGE